MINLSDTQIFDFMQSAAFRAFFEVFHTKTTNVIAFDIFKKKAILFFNNGGFLFAFNVTTPEKLAKTDILQCKVEIEKYKPFLGEKRGFKFNIAFSKAQILDNCLEENGYGYGFIINTIRDSIKESFPMEFLEI
jgi:hypothetical protein